jgi:hypothetical protein
VDENFLAKLIDVGTELTFPAGTTLPELHGMLLVMQGVLEVDGDERGPGHVVGQWERLDEVTIVAQTDVRLISIDRADYEAAQTG